MVSCLISLVLLEMDDVGVDKRRVSPSGQTKGRWSERGGRRDAFVIC